VTALMAPPQPQARPRTCTRCLFGNPKRRRRETRIPMGFPENQNPGSIIETFERHPWLEGSSLGALSQSLRDAVIST
jgi:hypothetical protein